MIITEFTVPRARLFRGLGSKLYLSNKQRMLNKDLAQFMLSRVGQKRISAGGGGRGAGGVSE